MFILVQVSVCIIMMNTIKQWCIMVLIELAN